MLYVVVDYDVCGYLSYTLYILHVRLTVTLGSFRIPTFVTTCELYSVLDATPRARRRLPENEGSSRHQDLALVTCTGVIVFHNFEICQKFV